MVIPHSSLHPYYPAFYPEVISVAATDQKDEKWEIQTTVQKCPFLHQAQHILIGPYLWHKHNVTGHTYTFDDGTSQAAAYVSGLAALIWSRNSTLSNQQVRQTIQNNCDNIDALNPNHAGKLGNGRINAFRALSNTPLPPVGFQLLRKYEFPQKNNGSSTGLSLARITVGLITKGVLVFLTQQPLSEKIYYLNPQDGSVLGSITPAGNYTIGSLEWDGNNIRVANVTTGSGTINSINPITGAQIDSIPAPQGRGEGLAYDGKYLYYSTITRISVLDPTNGNILMSYRPLAEIVAHWHIARDTYSAVTHQQAP